MEPLEQLQALIDEAGKMEELPVLELGGHDPLAKIQALMSGDFDEPIPPVSGGATTEVPKGEERVGGEKGNQSTPALLGEFVLRGLKQRPLAGEQRERAAYLLASYMQESGEGEDPRLQELLEVLIFDGSR